MNATKTRRRQRGEYRNHSANAQLHKLAGQMESLRCELLDFIEAKSAPPAMLRPLLDYGINLDRHLGGLAVFLELVTGDILGNLFPPTASPVKVRKAS